MPTKYLDGVRIMPGFDARQYDSYLIDVRYPPVAGNDVSSENLAAYLKREVGHQLQQMHFQEASAAGPKTLKCDLAITELDPGSRALRWWFGEFGAGHSIVQVEGRISDATGRELLAFVEKRRGAAVIDITGGDSQALLEDDLRQVAEGIMKQMFIPE